MNQQKPATLDLCARFMQMASGPELCGLTSLGPVTYYIL